VALAHAREARKSAAAEAPAAAEEVDELEGIL
jgi:hypothetical protein